MVDELEVILKQVRMSAGDAWMSCTSAVHILCSNLGYEDEGELEVRPLPRPNFSDPTPERERAGKREGNMFASS